MAEIRNERRVLGGAVRRIREAKKITQAELATASGVHFAYLSNIERGKRQPSLDLTLRLCSALGVDLDDISYIAVIYVMAEDAA